MRTEFHDVVFREVDEVGSLHAAEVINLHRRVVRKYWPGDVRLGRKTHLGKIRVFCTMSESMESIHAPLLDGYSSEQPGIVSWKSLVR